MEETVTLPPKQIECPTFPLVPADTVGVLGAANRMGFAVNNVNNEITEETV